MTDVRPAAPTCPGPPSRRRFLGAGFGAGLLGSVCCFGCAVAIGASLGGLSFFSTWMERYQGYFVVGSLLVMGFWLVRQLRRERAAGGATMRMFLRTAWPRIAVMGVVYVVMLALGHAVVAVVHPSNM